MRFSKLNFILKDGVAQGASDWHIKENAPISLRIAGEMVIQDTMATPEFMQEVLQDIVSDKMMAAYENVGDADFAVDEEDVGRFRVNLHRQRGLNCLTLRHVKSEVPDLEKLRLPKVILPLAESKDGIVFVTGATGSGKSTTLACMIQHINTTLHRHLITVEDPIEYDFTDAKSVIEQREVGLDTISFDSALRHALRQDPDIIVVGELRARESFETAMRAAETGHLVMTTLHTNTAAQSIDRILDFYPHEEREFVRKNLANNLRGIICQRLVPRSAGGGVVPINEVLINTPVISKLIEDGNIGKIDGAIAGGTNDGMQSFNRALLALVQKGEISEDAAKRFSPNPEQLSMQMKGIFLSNVGGITG